MTPHHDAQLRSFLHELGADPHTINETLATATFIELPTRHILLHQGQQPTHSYFLISGICHACYLTEQNQQISKEFYWEPTLIWNSESIIKNTTSSYLLETLSPSQIIMLPIDLLTQWRKQNNSIYQALLERQLQHKENKEQLMLMYSPEQRLQLFSQYVPNLLSYITNDQLMSYLGIMPTK